MQDAELSRRERKKEETRQRIIEQALLLIEQQDYDRVTMEQIAEAADVAKGTLYNYFPAKEAIISAFMRSCASKAAPEVERLIATAGNTSERLVSLFVQVGHWQLPHRAILERYLSYRMTQLLESARNPALRSGFEQNLLKVIQRGIDDGELRHDLSATALCSYLQSAYLGIMVNWLAFEEFDYIAGLKQMVSLFLDGATCNPAKGESA